MEKTLSKITAELGAYIPFLAIRYVDSPLNFNLAQVDASDARFLISLIYNNCKCVQDLRRFYLWLGSNPTWMHAPPFSSHRDWNDFMGIYINNDKHVYLLFKIIMDLRRMSNEEDRLLLQTS